MGGRPGDCFGEHVGGAGEAHSNVVGIAELIALHPRGYSEIVGVGNGGFMQGRNVAKLRAIVVASFTVVLLAVAAVFLSYQWTALGDARQAEADAIASADVAQSTYDAAAEYYDSAQNAYSVWYACWISTSYYWDWVCGSESEVQAGIDKATNLKNIAFDELSDAKTAKVQAILEVNTAAESFNSAALWWGIGAGVSVLLTSVFIAFAVRVGRKRRASSANGAVAGWRCPNCDNENAGGLFCVGCGHVRGDGSGTASAHIPPSDAFAQVSQTSESERHSEPVREDENDS